MKIDTKNLKSFKKTFDVLKNSNSPYYEYVYFDFSEQKIIFRNENCIVRIPLIIEEMEEDENPENFLVEGSKFFFIAYRYDQLTLKDKVFYSNDGGKFKIPVMEEEMAYPSLEKETPSDSGYFVIDDQTHDFLKTSLDYLEKDSMSPYSALFFEKGKMMALSPTRFFSVDLPEENKNLSFYLPVFVVRLLVSLGVTGKIGFKRKDKNNNFISELLTESFSIYFTSQSYELPVDPFSEEFENSFMHDNSVELPLEEFSSSVNFLFEFFKDTKSAHCRIKFLSEEKKVEFYLPMEGETSYSCSVNSFSDSNYFSNKEMWVSLHSLKSVTQSFIKNVEDKEFIIMRYEDEAPAVLFTQEKGFFIVQTLLEDPTA